MYDLRIYASLTDRLFDYYGREKRRKKGDDDKNKFHIQSVSFVIVQLNVVSLIMSQDVRQTWTSKKEKKGGKVISLLLQN